MVVPPYPYCLEEDRHSVPLDDCWYARPELFFTCHLRPAHGRLPKNSTYKHGPDDLCYTLVFFSTFEVLDLPFKGPMEDAGVVKLYEPSPTPCLYVAPAENMVGRVPLIPCFLAGNSTPTIPHKFSKRRDSGFSVRLCRLCGCGWKTRQQCVRGKPVAVAVWSRKAALGWSDGRRNHGQEERSGRSTAQEGSGDETVLQGGSSLV